MLHILLMILKIIGITLLAVVGIVLLLLLAALFVPVRYKIKGKKEETDIDGSFRISWLLNVIRITGIYTNGSFSYKLRIFGVDLFKLFSRVKKKKRPQKQKIVALKTSAQQKNNILDEKQKDTMEKPEEPASPKKNKIRNWFGNIVKIPGRIIKRIKNFLLTIRNIYDKIKHLKELWNQDSTKEVVLLLKKNLIKCLKHIFPKKISGMILFGFDDPCTTGQVLAGVSMFYPLYYKSLQITPDFTKNVFQGQVLCKGRIYGFFILKTVLSIYFDRNVQSLIQKFQNKEAL